MQTHKLGQKQPLYSSYHNKIKKTENAIIKQYSENTGHDVNKPSPIPQQEQSQESEKTEDAVHVSVQIQDSDRGGDQQFPSHVKPAKYEIEIRKYHVIKRKL